MTEPGPATSPIPLGQARTLVATLPPAPFVQADPADRCAPLRSLSPRVVVLIGAAIIVGILLWMARDSVRPFIVGLLAVYLLDPPVRWLVRRGVRRTLAIVGVYVVAFVLLFEFLNLTLTPLVNELLRFIDDFPRARRAAPGPARTGGRLLRAAPDPRGDPRVDRCR